MNRYYFAMDIGMSGGRHILRWMENGEMKLREIYRSSDGMEVVDGTLCWNLSGFFEKIKARMRKCKRLGINPESMGIDTWAVDFALLDRQGHVLGKTAGYRDRCTEGMDSKVYEQISREEPPRRTGIQEQVFNTVYRLMAVKERKPDILSKAEGFLMIPNYLNFLLTGVKKQEYINVITTQLVNPSECAWDRGLIEVLGYPQKLLDGLSMPGTVVGRPSEDVRKGIGLDYRVVLPAIHDTGCTVATVPPNCSHVLYISSGTWSLMGTELKDTGCQEANMEASFTDEGGYEYRYRLLRDIMGLRMIQFVRKEWKESGEDYPFGEICERVPCKVIFSIVDCNDSRFLTPESMCGAVKTYCKESRQRVSETKWEIVTMTCNSLTDYHHIYYREIQASTGVRYDCIYTVGGGANADYLNRLTAKVTGKTVYAGPTEATATGNPAMQMIEGKGFESLEGARDSILRPFEMEAYEPSEEVC